MKKNNIFTDIPENLSEEIFETLVQSKHVKIERIISNGQTSPTSGWFCQEEHEWVILLKGEASILFHPDQETRLSPGDYLHIPAHTRHRVTHTHPQTTTIWLAIHYASHHHPN